MKTFFLLVVAAGGFMCAKQDPTSAFYTTTSLRSIASRVRAVDRKAANAKFKARYPGPHFHQRFQVVGSRA